MGWGTKKAAAAPQPVRSEAAAAIEVMERTTWAPKEEEPPKEKPTDAAKAQIEWHKLKSKKGWTDTTLAMVLYEFIQEKALFADLVKFARKR